MLDAVCKDQAPPCSIYTFQMYLIVFCIFLYMLWSLFKFYIQIVVWYFKGLLWTFLSVHASVILGDFCYWTPVSQSPNKQGEWRINFQYTSNLPFASKTHTSVNFPGVMHTDKFGMIDLKKSLRWHFLKSEWPDTLIHSKTWSSLVIRMWRVWWFLWVYLIFHYITACRLIDLFHMSVCDIFHVKKVLS